MNSVLLIEPDRILAEIYKQAIEAADIGQVTAVSGAQAAIMAADQQMPDVVILELQLIEHSGVEFLYEFRSYSEWQSIPIIVQTVVPFGEFHDNWQLLQNELGVSTYLYKPHTSLRQLLNSVEEHSFVVT
jgi:DNA-binding response OmpR family regulator